MPENNSIKCIAIQNKRRIVKTMEGNKANHRPGGTGQRKGKEK